MSIPSTSTAASPLDVLIVGAGISGLGLGCQLKRQCPGMRFEILERRSRVGGTWDLFRYPGIRSDSDMLTFSFALNPWKKEAPLANGREIQAYLHETAEEFGVIEHIRFGQKVGRLSWSSAEGLWTAESLDLASGQSRSVKAKILVAATGYYNHDKGYLPQFPGQDNFRGQLVHPQHWPEDLDYAGKKVVVIGSGATAVTLIPAMAEQAGELTMLQRSPSYIYSLPLHDPMANWARKNLSEERAYRFLRARNLFISRLLFKLCRRFPQFMRQRLIGAAAKRLGPGFDMRHFTPRYMPWDERLCVVPGGDLFKVLRSGKAKVETDTIAEFLPQGIRLSSGKVLEADIIIAATGLELQTLGGMQLEVDGAAQTVSQKLTYKGVLVDGIPNFAYLFGYTNASWTLKINIATDYLCRLFNVLRAKKADRFEVTAPAGMMVESESIMNSLAAGYVQRGGQHLPRQGKVLPWKVLHHYEKDEAMLKAPVEDGLLQMS